MYTRTYEEHVEALDRVFERVNKYGLFFRPDKCKVFTKEIKFLGHIISEDGVATDPDKTKAVRDMPKPRTKKKSWKKFTSTSPSLFSGFADSLPQGNGQATTPTATSR